jgi:hypothetical protein
LTNHTSRKSKKPRVTLPLLELAHFTLTNVQSCTCQYYSFFPQKTEKSRRFYARL